MKVYSVVSDSLWPLGLYSPWNSLDQNTGVCSHCLLQGIFPTQGLDTGLLHCGQILYQLSHQGSPISFIMFWIYLWKPQCSRCMVPTAMAVDKSIHEKHGEWEGTRTRRETVELQCSVPRRKSWQQGWRSATMGECNQEQQFPETKKVPAKCKGAKSSGVQDGW